MAPSATFMISATRSALTPVLAMIGVFGAASFAAMRSPMAMGLPRQR